MNDLRMAAVFFDRDGTLIEDAGYPRDPDEVRFLPEAKSTLMALQQKGFRLILVSNQSGIGRGLITPDEARQVHERVMAGLKEHGVELTAAYYCPHAPEDQCSCRKPSPEMILRAGREHRIDLSRSFMVGDTPADIEAGRRAGCRTIQLRHQTATPVGAAAADYVAVGWTQVLDLIVGAKETQT